MLNEYQEFTKTTNKYREVIQNIEKQKTKDALYLQVLTCGLNEEAGEVAGQVKKMLRDDKGNIESKRVDNILKELGDVLWYVSEIANHFNCSLDMILMLNKAKLTDRYARNKIHGDGDNR